MSFINLSQIGFGDTQSVDAFSRLRVSMANSVFDSQLEYGLDTRRTWDAAANGTLAASSSNGSAVSGSNAVGPVDSNTRMCPLTVSTTNGHYSVVQTKQYVRYVPGKSHLVFVTGVFASGGSYTASFVRRTSTSGSVVDNVVTQADWNIDMFDGTGPSGKTLDFTKTQIMFISAQWLGVGRVIVGFDVDGQMYPAHQFLNANVLTVPYTQTFNLPVRMEIRNAGIAESTVRGGYFDSANGVFLQTSRNTAGGTAYLNCCSVQSEGGVDLPGFPWSASMGAAAVSVTTRRPIISIRPKATFNSRTNRAHIDNIEFELYSDAAALYELVIGGTLTGASFASVGADSVAEFDTAATTISGGTALVTGYVTSGFKASSAAAGGADLRYPLVLSQIDALTANQTNVSVVVTRFSGATNMAAAIDWHEQVC